MKRLAIFLIAISSVSMWAQTIPKGYVVPPITMSPDQKFGVTVPMLEMEEQLKTPQNSVIELKTGKVAGVIQTEYVAEDHMNHDTIVQTLWSADDAVLLWQVDGKWGFSTEVLICLEDGKIKWQVDVLKKIEEEILKRTRASDPAKYEEVKTDNAGYGSWYKDGFAVDSVLQGDALKFPLVFDVYLTSDTKAPSGGAKVDSRMTAEVAKDGSLRVTNFHLGTSPPARNW